MNDDIKRALEAIYGVKEETVAELAPEPKGAQAAAAHMDQEADLKGSFNAKTFAGLLGMDSTEASMLASFLAKHKKGMPPSRNELLAAADAFRALIDADTQITNQAMMMLRRVSAAEAIESPVAEDQVEKTSLENQIEEEVKDIAEGIRITKEGVEECWSDMATNAATGQKEQMTVNIAMPNKQISVTTDSAEEIMSVLKLAGIAVGEPAAEPEAPVVTMMPMVGGDEPQAAMVGAPGVTPAENDSESDEEESEEEKKEESVEPQGPAVEEQDAFTMAAAAAAREGQDEFEFPKGSGKMHPVKISKDAAHKMSEGENQQDSESARILKLAGLDEAKFANAPANSEGEAREYDRLPSAPGDGGGKPEYGTRQSNIGGENPMALKTLDVDMEESFQIAMGEYRKFVAENISQGVKKV